MAHLKVRLRGQQILDVQLQKEKTYLAGRKEDCDILLPADTGISREHFQISFQNGQWRLSVVSKFGFVLFSGEKLQNLDLNEPMLFSVPPYEFEFTGDGAKKNEVAIRSQTSPMGVDSFDDEKTHVGQSQLVPLLKMLDSHQTVLSNIRLDQGDFFLAGREATCQIHIQDQRVSRKQFEIHRQGNDFTIIDPGSANGTYLNGEQLTPHTPILLRSGDLIVVLDNSMVFELYDPNFQQMVEQVKSLSVVGEPQWSPEQHPLSPYGAGSPSTTYDPRIYATKENPQFDIRKMNFKDIDFKKHKARIIMGVGAFFLIVIALFSGGDNKDQDSKAGMKANDLLAKLTQDQKNMLKHHYQLAENYLAQQKWSLAKGEIEKVKEILPETYRQYERTKDLENNAEQGLLNEQEIEKLEAQQEQQRLLQEKITAQVAECRKLVNPNISEDEIEICLQPALQLSPEDPQIQQLKGMVDQIVTERAAAQEKKKEGDLQAAQLKALFQRAEREERAEDYLSALRSYDGVVRSSLPDRESLKFKAQRQINMIRGQMASKTSQYISDAEKSVQEQQYKNALLTLRKAKKIDPNNSDVDEKIENYTRELRKQMLVIFQEAILEEGFGNIEGSEGKPGAKDKWKKILELDVPDGEYYQKAKQRLRKYGVI